MRVFLGLMALIFLAVILVPSALQFFARPGVLSTMHAWVVLALLILALLFYGGRWGDWR